MACTGETPRRKALTRSGKTGVEASNPRGEAPSLSLGPLEFLIGFHLRLAQDASFRGFSRRVRHADLTPGRFAAMMIIHNNPGVNQSALSHAIGRDKSSITSLLQKLERERLVIRTPHAADGRSHGLALTAAGERTLRALKRQALAHDRQLDGIVGERKAELIRLLKRIAQEFG